METWTITDWDTMQKVSQALSLDVRLKVFKLLQNEELNINEIAGRLSIPVATATVNIQKLEEAGLVSSVQKPGIRGSQKICSAKYSKILFSFDGQEKAKTNLLTSKTYMPVGQFVKCRVNPTCGMISETATIGKFDNSQSFYLPERVHAQLIWLTNGYLEYNFPNDVPAGAVIQSMEFSAELCSEAFRYKMDCPSDITLWINGQEISTWTSPSDFGGKRGKLTPQWWKPYKTQYGLMTCWKITESGAYLNGAEAGTVKLSDLHLEDKPYISVRIGIKDGAKKSMGFNVFGSKCGNYPQDLLLKMDYTLE